MPQPLSFSEQHVKRFSVIDQIMRDGPSTRTAAAMLDMSRRQVFRIMSMVKLQCLADVRQGNCGRTTADALPLRLCRRVLDLYRKEFFNFDFAHFSRTVADEFEIHLSRETVRRRPRSNQLGPAPHRSTTIAADVGANPVPV